MPILAFQCDGEFSDSALRQALAIDSKLIAACCYGASCVIVPFENTGASRFDILETFASGRAKAMTWRA